MFDLSKFPSVYPEWEVANLFQGDNLCTSESDANLQAVYEGSTLVRITVNCDKGTFIFRPNGDSLQAGDLYQLRHIKPQITMHVALLPGGKAQWFSNEKSAIAMAKSLGGLHVTHIAEVPASFRNGVPLEALPPR